MDYKDLSLLLPEVFIKNLMQEYGSIIHLNGPNKIKNIDLIRYLFGRLDKRFLATFNPTSTPGIIESSSTVVYKWSHEDEIKIGKNLQTPINVTEPVTLEIIKSSGNVHLKFGDIANNSESSITSIDSFGDIDLKGFTIHSPTLTSVPSKLPRTVTTLAASFNSCPIFNDPNISNWNVSNVTDMSNMFYGCTNFNQPLDNWDTRNVLDMGSMFYGCTNFEQNLAIWNVSRIKNPPVMFSNLSGFNNSVLHPKWGHDCWDVIIVLDRTKGDTALRVNGELDIRLIEDGVITPVESIKLTTVTDRWESRILTGTSNRSYLVIKNPLNLRVDYIFECFGAITEIISLGKDFLKTFQINSEFFTTITPYLPKTITSLFYTFGATNSLYIPGINKKHSINFNDVNIKYWNTENVNNLTGVFYNCTSFNQNLNNWDTSNVTNMSNMFNRATSFNQDISRWNTSKVESLANMFENCSNFNQPLDNWDVSNVTNMQAMFYRASSFNSNISNWDVSNIRQMGGMFYGCTNFNQDISNWNTSKVESLASTFNNCTNFNADISNWDLSNLTTLYSTFSGCTNFNADISKWDVSKIKSIGSILYYTNNFTRDISNWDTQNANLSSISSQVHSNFPLSKQPLWGIPNTRDNLILVLKRGTLTITSNKIGIKYKTSSMTSIATTTDLTSTYVLEPVFGNPHEYLAIYLDSDITELTISGTALVSVFSFGTMPNLSKLSFKDSPNLIKVPNQITSTLTNCDEMFKNCTNFNDINISNWDTSNVTSMNEMFSGCSNIDIDLSGWNVLNVPASSRIGFDTNTPRWYKSKPIWND